MSVANSFQSNLSKHNKLIQSLKHTYCLLNLFVYLIGVTKFCRDGLHKAMFVSVMYLVSFKLDVT